MEREADGEDRLTAQRLDMTKAWLNKHETIGSHMRDWTRYVVPPLLEEGYLPSRLWEAGFRTKQLAELMGYRGAG